MKMFFYLLISILMLSCGDGRSSNVRSCEKQIHKILSDKPGLGFRCQSFRIGMKVLKEETYLPKISALVIELENASTKTVDFKKLSDNKYERFENFSQTENSLKLEAVPLAKAISEACDISDFDEIIIEFTKYKKSNTRPLYRFICHYPLVELTQE